MNYKKMSSAKNIIFQYVPPWWCRSMYTNISKLIKTEGYTVSCLVCRYSQCRWRRWFLLFVFLSLHLKL